MSPVGSYWEPEPSALSREPQRCPFSVVEKTEIVSYTNLLCSLRVPLGVGLQASGSTSATVSSLNMNACFTSLKIDQRSDFKSVVWQENLHSQLYHRKPLASSARLNQRRRGDGREQRTRRKNARIKGK